MRISSAISDRYSVVDDNSSSAQSNFAAPPASKSPVLRLPEFGNYAHASTARRAGRINAGSISEREYKNLLDERQELLDKKFDGTITKREANRLTYVEWNLDRVEDARNGDHLDKLEDVVLRYEHFRRDLEDLVEQLKAASSSRHER